MILPTCTVLPTIYPSTITMGIQCQVCHVTLIPQCLCAAILGKFSSVIGTLQQDDLLIVSKFDQDRAEFVILTSIPSLTMEVDLHLDMVLWSFWI